MCKICVCIYTYIFRYFLHSILTQFQGGTNEVKHGTWHFLMAKVLRQNLDQTLPKSDSSNLDIVKLPSFHKYRANSLAAIYINNCLQFLPNTYLPLPSELSEHLSILPIALEWNFIFLVEEKKWRKKAPTFFEHFFSGPQSRGLTQMRSVSSLVGVDETEMQANQTKPTAATDNDDALLAVGTVGWRERKCEKLAANS